MYSKSFSTVKNASLIVGDQVLSATVYFDNMSYEDAIQILEHAQAYKVKLCLKRNPEIKETDPATQSDVIHVTILELPVYSIFPYSLKMND